MTVQQSTGLELVSPESDAFESLEEQLDGLELLEDPRPGRTAYTLTVTDWNHADQRRSEWVETTLVCDLEAWR